MKEIFQEYGGIFNYRGSDSCSDPCHYSSCGNGHKRTHRECVSDTGEKFY